MNRSASEHPPASAVETAAMVMIRRRERSFQAAPVSQRELRRGTVLFMHIRAASRQVTVALQRLAELCYPATCGVCGSFCDGPAWLCETCGAHLMEMEQQAGCPRCAMPLPQASAPCPWCRGKGRHPLQRIARLANFDEPLRGLIHRMKYDGKWPVAELLADRLLKRPLVAELLGEADAVVAIPLHLRKQFERGYNQSEVLARRLAGRCGKRVMAPVRRVRDTHSQTMLTSQKARLENMRGAFALRRPKSVEGKHLLLVDDVITSGATLRSAARALMEGNPASISAIVIAAADPRGRGFRRI